MDRDNSTFGSDNSTISKQQQTKQIKLNLLKKRILRKIITQLDSTHTVLKFQSGNEIGSAFYIDPNDFDAT